HQKKAAPNISNRNSRFTGFRSTRCKHNLYQFSNRNKNACFAVSNLRFFSPRVMGSESPLTDFLIETPRLEFSVTRTKHKPAIDSNRYKIGLFFRACAGAHSPVARHESQAANYKSRLIPQYNPARPPCRY